jgi:hypothetical protein
MRGEISLFASRRGSQLSTGEHLPLNLLIDPTEFAIDLTVTFIVKLHI